MLTLGTNNGLLVCVSFGSFSIILYRYLLFLFHSFDVAILLFDDGTNETIYECMVITITRDERCYCTGSAGLRTEKSGRPITIITRYLCGYWRRKISYPTLVMTISTIAKRSDEARGTVQQVLCSKYQYREEGDPIHHSAHRPMKRLLSNKLSLLLLVVVSDRSI